MPRDLRPHLLAAGLLLAASCRASRAGWGKGPWRELHESGELQIRRAVVRVDERTGELWLPWIGARVPPGVSGEIDACELALYRDDDGDHRLDPGETVLSRSSTQPGVKVLFEDLRVRPPASGAELVARIDVRTGANSRRIQFLVRSGS